MYNIIPLICGGLMIILGLFMAINPVISTKRELRDDAKVVGKTRRSGFIMVVCGFICIILGIILNSL